VRLAVNSASSTIPCRASSSLISRCSHYVCQIVVWRTNLEVTPGWAILFSGFVVGPLFVAIMISIAIWLFRVLLTTLGLKASPQKRSPKFATRAQKQKQMEDNEIVDAEWTEVHGIENRGQ
ncbi:hypothetical protein, partial [Sphingobium sp.]|uniref:hypothetical protein n=1 Tax=Sphingobium sp. TaxID=1912891 RepID=UPI003BB7ECB7